jgi:hypothetical protein
VAPNAIAAKVSWHRRPIRARIRLGAAGTELGPSPVRREHSPPATSPFPRTRWSSYTRGHTGISPYRPLLFLLRHVGALRMYVYVSAARLEEPLVTLKSPSHSSRMGIPICSSLIGVVVLAKCLIVHARVCWLPALRVAPRHEVELFTVHGRAEHRVQWCRLGVSFPIHLGGSDSFRRRYTRTASSRSNAMIT